MPEIVHNIPVGFHFKVDFNIGDIPFLNHGFQEISGLSVNMSTTEVAEGGENRFKHQIPERPKYSNLVLKRGLIIGSDVIKWCRDAIENYDFRRANVEIDLLNSLNIPVISWNVIDAYPVKWEVTTFNAEKSELVIETIELTYKYFNIIGSGHLRPKF